MSQSSLNFERARAVLNAIRQRLATLRSLSKRRGVGASRFTGIEPLEGRVMLTAVSWDGGGDGVNWSNAANWSNDTLPASGDDVTINVAGTPTINFTGAAGNVSINSLTSNESLNFTGGSLAVAGTLAINTQNLTLAGGTIKNATISTSGGSQLLVSGSATLDGVTLNTNLDLSAGSVSVNVLNGLTLNATATLGYEGRIYFSGGSQTLGGTGTVVFNNTVRQGLIANANNMTLTIGPGITVRGGNNNLNTSYGSVIGFSDYWGGGTNTSIINQGVIAADVAGTGILINPRGTGVFTNTGTLSAINGGSLFVYAMTDASDGLIRSTAGSSIYLQKNLLSTSTSASTFAPAGTTTFNGTGTAGSPQQVEVMGDDAGAASAGFTNNFVYGTLALSGTTYVKLVDQSDNSAGAGAEALYTNSLILPAGTTLDLNGLHLYTRAAQLSGTILNGTITQIPDSGALSINAATPGSISVAGQLDEWTFFGHGGQSVTVTVNPGATGSSPPFAPQLNWANVQLLDSANTVLASGASATSGALVTLANITLPADGNYKIRINAAAGHTASTGNYVVTAWDVTADVATLNFGQTLVGNIETPYAVDRWTFAATAGQQVRFDLINQTSSGLAFTLTGPNGFSGFTDIPGDSDLITLPYSGTYTLTARGTGGAIGAYAFQVPQTSQATLNPGASYNGNIAGSGQAQLFLVPVTEASPLLVRFDAADNASRNEVYVKYGSPPTRGVFDYRYSIPNGADQSIVVPNAQAGDWYVLVYSNTAASPTNYTISAIASDVLAFSSTPNQSAANSYVPITVTGAGFVSGTTVQLVNASNQVIATGNTEIDSYTQVTSTFDLTAVTPGTYGVRVASPGGDADVLPNAITVSAAGVGHLETRLIMPRALGRHALGTVYLEYANTGNAPMAAPLIRLQSADIDNSDRPLLTLDQSKVTAGFWTSAIPDGFSNSVQILASGESPGVLNPGERIQVPVYYAGLQQPWTFSDSQVEMELRIFDSTTADLVPWADLKDELRPSTVNSDAWDVIYGNIEANVGPAWGNFVQMLSENAQYLGRLGENVVDVASLWSFEVQQAIGISPVSTIASSLDAAVVAAGADLAFGRSYALSIDQRFENTMFGMGWDTPWETHLVTDADGTVNIVGPGGSRRRFQPDSRVSGRYFAAAGDTGILAVGYITFPSIREQDGSLTVFYPNGKLFYTEDPNGNRITATWDAGGHLATLVHNRGGSLSFGYDLAGHVTSIQDSAGRQTTFTYDATSRYLLTATSPDGLVTTYTYNTDPGPRQHALASITTGGVTQNFTYDSRGRLLSSDTNGNTSTINFGYDNAGKVTVTDAGGGSSQLFYNELGLLKKVADPFGNVTTTSYGDDLRIEQIVDPTGRTQSFTWCDCGSMTSSTDQLGNTTTFTYDYVGPNNTIRRMTSFTDARGNTTRYNYDAKGNLTATIYPNGSIERTTGYDPAGDPLSFINRRGQVMNYTYNAAGQVTRQTFTDNTYIDLAYDTHGNLTTVTEPGNRVTTYQYDTGDRLTRVTYPEGRFLAFTYDAAGRRATMTDQLGYVLRYSYDAAGRLYQLRDTANTLIVQYTYDTAGRLSRKDNGNNTYTLYTYDLAGQVLSIYNRAPNGSVNSSFVYTYDALGRRTSMTTIDGAWTYGYDATSQLTTAVFVPVQGSPVPAQNLQYVYDAVGNRIRTIENGVTTNYTTNNLNQYTQVGGDTLIYDADGNLISRAGPGGNATYTYDQQSRLTRVVTPEGTWVYEYDSFGNRTASTQSGMRTEYLLDPSGLVDVVGEYTGAGVLSARYVHGDGLVSHQDGSAATMAFFDFDAIGNTSSLTSIMGQLENYCVYEPFGQVLVGNEAIATPFDFLGQFGVENAGNNLHYMRARYFDSNYGRFTSSDPMRIQAGDVNFNRYSRNNPIRFLDPTGLDCFDTTPRWGRTWKDSYKLSSATYPRSFLERHIAGTYGPALPGIQDRLIQLKRWQGRPEEDNPFDSLASWDAFIVRHALAYAEAIVSLLSFGCLGNSPFQPLAPVPDATLGPGTSAVAANAQDPNELYGPAGYGSPNFLAADAALPYRIEFENYGPGSVESDGTPAPSSRWATAPAQRVEVENKLPADLDLDTFALTGFGFGDFNLPIAGGVQHHAQTLTMTYNNQTFEVWFEAGLDRATRTLRVVFQSIDPFTELPPDVLTGFLPPEDGTGRGRGYVNYLARANAGLATGTAFRNVALITFDGQTAIATNQIDPLDPTLGTDPNKEALVTLDAGTPTSSVSALPGTTTTPQFNVNWFGNDDANGSGVAAYNVYVSDNGGAYTLWQDRTTATNADFTGVNGHTYAFYSVAIDNVGHVENAPAFADTQTTMQTISAGGVLNAGLLSIDGSDGDDSITLTNTAGAYALTIVTPQGTVNQQFTGVTSVVINALAGNDTVTLGAGVVGATVNGNEGDDTLTSGPGSDSLIGGPGNDRYVFPTSTAAQTDTITELPGAGAGEGEDTLDFSGLGASDPVTINLGSATTALGGHTNRTVNVASAGQAANIENLIGGSGGDTLTGNAAANKLTGGAGSDNLTGGSGNDSYLFGPATLAETDKITELSSGGTDTLDFSSLGGGDGVTINLASTTTALGSHTNRTLILGASGQAAQIENVTGGAGADNLTGNTAANVLIGNAGGDTLNGGSGNDTLDGGEGSDSLIGSSGNDFYLFSTALAVQTDTITELSSGGTDTLDFGTLGASDGVTVNLASTTTSLGSHANRTPLLNAAGTTTQLENVTGGSGGDNLTGNASTNILIGNAGADTLNGGAGNDTLDGGEGNDALIGGSGNDLYQFAAAVAVQTDTITELASGGTDTLDFSVLGGGDALTINLASTTTSLGSHTNRTLLLNAAGSTTQLENVTGGAGNDSLTGNASTNILIGNAGNDTLDGGAGNDTLNGGEGNDALIGGAGNDLYQFATAAAVQTDTITELASGGTDSLDFSTLASGDGVTVNLASTTTSLGSHTNRTLILGASGQAAQIENVTGGAGNDNLTGNASANSLTGNAGNDTLTGAAGNDTLNSGAGSDTLIGGANDDTYIFGAASAAETDTIVEQANEGTDTLDFSGLSSTTPLTLNLSSATTSAGSHTNRLINYGSAGQGANFENVKGGAGADNITGNAAANVLTGNAGNDTLTGGSGNDTLTGGAGNDTLIGGANDDTYIFGSASAAETDTIVEQPNEGTDTLDFSGLSSTTPLTLNLSSATTSAGSHTNRVINYGAAGQAANFENVKGGAGNDVITGNASANVLTGNAGNDTLDGGAGNDTLTGGSGSDTLTGGADDDAYIFAAASSTAPETDTIVELAVVGTDTLDFSGLTSTTPLTLNLASVTTSAGSHLYRTLNYGSAGQGANFENVKGGAGNDVITGNTSANVLTGNGGGDTLDGGAGNDTLDGGTGNDTLIGGANDDTFVFGSPSGTEIDTISELSGGGFDTISFQAIFSATLAVTVDLSKDSGIATMSGRTINTGGVGQRSFFERLLGGAGNDTFKLRDAQAQVVDGGGGSNSAQLDALLDTWSNIQTILP